MEPIEISASASEDTVGKQEAQDRKKAELDAKLDLNKKARQTTRQNRLIVQGEEEKLPEEDYNLIDEYFNSTYAEL